jgi:hypothetical protein
MNWDIFLLKFLCVSRTDRSPESVPRLDISHGWPAQAPAGARRRPAPCLLPRRQRALAVTVTMRSDWQSGRSPVTVTMNFCYFSLSGVRGAAESASAAAARARAYVTLTVESTPRASLRLLSRSFSESLRLCLSLSLTSAGPGLDLALLFGRPCRRRRGPGEADQRENSSWTRMGRASANYFRQQCTHCLFVALPSVVIYSDS